MLSVIPGTSSNDTQGALAILQTLAVDSKYKSRLQELISQAKQADEKLNDLRTAEHSAKMKLAATEALHSSLMAESERITAEAEAARKQADKLHADLAARERAFAALQAEDAEKRKLSVEAWTAHKKEISDELEAVRSKNDKIAKENKCNAAELRKIEDKLTEREAALEAAVAKNEAEAKELAAMRVSLETALGKINAVAASLK